MEILVPLLLKGVAAPALAAALLLLPARGRAAGGWACAALGLAYATGHGLLRRPWPIAESTDRLAWLAAGLALAAALVPWRSGLPALGARLALVVAGSAWWLGPLVTSRPGAEAAGLLALLGAGLVVPWTAADALARRRPGALAPAVALLTAVAAAAALLLSRTALYAQLAGALAASLAVAGLLARRRPALARAAAPAGAILAALLAAGVVLAELPLLAAALVVLAPAAATVTWTPPLRDATPRRALLVALLAVAAPLAVALAVAAVNAPPPSPY